MTIYFSPSTGRFYEGAPMPLDAEPSTQAALDASQPQPPPPTLADYENAVQGVLDSYAVSKGYRNADAMATFVSSTVTQWAAEATALVAWRDSCWSRSFLLLQQVNAGTAAQPTIASLIAILPPHP